MDEPFVQGIEIRLALVHDGTARTVVASALLKPDPQSFDEHGDDDPEAQSPARAQFRERLRIPLELRAWHWSPAEAGTVCRDLARWAATLAATPVRIHDTAAEGGNFGSVAEFRAHVQGVLGDLLRARYVTQAGSDAIVAAAERSPIGKTLDVRILAFNDFHGNIDGSNLTLRSDADGIFVEDPAGHARSAVSAGGVDYMAGLVAKLKAGAPNSVVVSAGTTPANRRSAMSSRMRSSRPRTRPRRAARWWRS